MLENKEMSGGTRFNAGKPGMWWAIPMKGLRLVARVTMRGSEKYAPLDWACGQSYSTLLDSASRHWIEVLTNGPLAKDDETGLLHLAHAAWNLLCLLHFIEEGREDLDDVTKWQGVNTAQKQAMEATEWIAPEGTIIPEDFVVTATDGQAVISRSPGAERMRRQAGKWAPTVSGCDGHGNPLPVSRPCPAPGCDCQDRAP